MYKYLYRRAKERVDSLLRTVMFYSDRKLYENSVENDASPVDYDKGSLARKTLKEISGEKWDVLEKEEKIQS